jgi:hypothetical protein
MQRPAYEKLDRIIYEEMMRRQEEHKKSVPHEISISPEDYCALRKSLTTEMLWSIRQSADMTLYRGWQLNPERSIRPGWVALHWADGTREEYPVWEAADAGENG